MLHAHRGQHGNPAKTLPLVNIAHVHLHIGGKVLHCLNRVTHGIRIMGVSARIEHHAVIVGAAGMDLVNQRALVVALVKIHLHALVLTISGQLPVNILQGL